MGLRARRALAGIGLLAFLAAYIWAAIAIGDRLPDVWWIKVIYFAVAGTAWGLPLGPLFAWAEGSSRKA